MDKNDLNLLASEAIEKILKLCDYRDDKEQLLLIANYIKPSDLIVKNKLIDFYFKKNDFSKAFSLAKKVVEQTSFKEIKYLMNAAIIAGDIGLQKEATELYRKVLKIDPKNNSAKFGLAIENLKRKNYKKGWELYFHRHEAFGCDMKHHEIIKNIPHWDGKSSGSIYFYNEQGYGDLIFSFRYWHNLKKLHKNFSILLDDNMEPLMRLSSFQKNINKKLIGKVFKCSFLDMPYFFKDYLFHPDEYEKNFLQHDKTVRGKINLGLVFQGSEDYPGNKRRNIGLEKLEPIISNKRFKITTFHKDVKPCASKFKINILGNKLVNYSKTFSELLKMDALLTIDSSVAHLGGLLGIPTYVLLDASPDFRWWPYSKKIPWYKSWKTFKQKELGKWDDVVEEVAKELYSDFLDE
jgi:hypothetical protein